MWSDYFIMTLSPFYWVPVQHKGSKRLYVKFGAMKVVPSDRLHQEYLTINLGITSDWQQLQLLLVKLCERLRDRILATGSDWRRGRDPGSVTHSLSYSLSHSFTLYLEKMQEQEYSQLLNIKILKFNSPVFLNLLGNILPYCPAFGAIRRINSSDIGLKKEQCWSCNWECLYYDLSQDNEM